MDALVGFQSVSAIPVTAALDKSLGPLDMFLDERLIAVEESDSYYGQDKIDLCAEDTSLLKDIFQCRNSFLLVFN